MVTVLPSSFAVYLIPVGTLTRLLPEVGIRATAVEEQPRNSTFVVNETRPVRIVTISNFEQEGKASSTVKVPFSLPET